MNQYEAQLCGLVVVCVTLVIRWVIGYLRDTEPAPRYTPLEPMTWSYIPEDHK